MTDQVSMPVEKPAITKLQQRALDRGTPLAGTVRPLAAIELPIDEFLCQASAFARTCPRYQTMTLLSNNYQIRADAYTAGFKRITTVNLTAAFYALRVMARKADRRTR